MDVSASGFYEKKGSNYLPTEATIGPWSAEAQHGGPPSALITAAMDAHNPRENTRLARIALEILRPIPLGPTEIDVHVERHGKKIELLAAEMKVNGHLVMIGRAWRIRVDKDQGPGIGLESVVPPSRFQARPITESEIYFPYGRSMEWSFDSGSFDEVGPAVAWARPKIPLVSGEATSSIARLMLMIDSANGISSVLPFGAWTFVPVDLVVSLYGVPQTEWIGMAAETIIGRDGIGQTKTTIFDESSSIGSSLHTLFVEPIRAT